MDFTARYKKLNEQQRKAVDTIDGPLLVIAGPGTGKTELLSMRTANILQKTDTLPENILCLTFTESGANAMRARLASIIGPAAYKVAIYTFHGFGTEIINQYREYFYSGADYQPADDLSSFALLTDIFDELSHENPLASKNNGDYVYLRDTMTAIGELKQAGLSSDELLNIVQANSEVLDTVEKELADIFSQKISTSMLSLLVPIAEKVAALPTPALPPAISPLGNDLALSMARAFDEAVATNKTTPITAWRNAWLEQTNEKRYVFKDRKRHAKLGALAHVYFVYLSRMEQARLYDYNDMVLNVVHAMELRPELRASLQERFQYIMVDEFQDTNLAQLRMLFALTDNPVGDAPNVMAVGDDDQAIYSFQGADVNNIHRFREQYPGFATCVLTDNYRSAESILVAAREVVTQANGRLENTMDILKTLTPHVSSQLASVERVCLPTRGDEYSWVAESVATAIKDGTSPNDIAILARNHNELVELVPYLHYHNVALNYERRDNVLDLPSIQTLELLSEVSVALFSGEHETADSKLPELLAHPMFAIPAETIWRLSLSARRNQLTWLESMLVTPNLKPLGEWLIERARVVAHEPLETFIDTLIGVPREEEVTAYRSPMYEYYFGSQVLKAAPDAYITVLEALRTLRTRLREFQPNETLHIPDFLEFMRMHRELGTGITSIRSSGVALDNAVTLMTAHKSKGLEFDTVYIINSVDSKWGERVRTRTPLITYPENLQIRPRNDTYDERLRLYFVAMTRAKRKLVLSYAALDTNERELLPASFLVGTSVPEQRLTPRHTVERLTTLNELAWHDYVTSEPTTDMKALLAPVLETYKLSSTHINNFIDITRGGPGLFLMHNLLRFPMAKSASASYGTAIHATLQRAHNHFTATGERRPIEDVLGDFIHELQRQRLAENEFAFYQKRGSDALASFLGSHYGSFTRSQRTELNFAGQNVTIHGARLTGSMDLIDIHSGAITVTDYKTGKPASSWKGRTDYEKIKLHKYKQQLMFYQLLCQHSRDYAKYDFAGGVLQFVEPDTSGKIFALEEQFTSEELDRFTKLIAAVWQCITTLDFPDTSDFESSYKGILAFEEYLIDNYTTSVV